MKNASETEMRKLWWVSDPHTVNSPDNELPCGRDNSVSPLRQATDTAHSSPSETPPDGNGNSEPAVGGIAGYVAKNARYRLQERKQAAETELALEHLAAQLQAALKAQKGSNHE